MKPIIKILILIFLFSCSSQESIENLTKSKISSPSPNTSSIYLFKDSTYIFTVTTIDTTIDTTDSYNPVEPTVNVNFLHFKNGLYDTLFSDFLFCRNHIAASKEIEITYEDFNFDGTKDIILPAGCDPRSNCGFHLFLVNNKRKKLTYVKGFSEIGNPYCDKENSIIQSMVVSSQPFYKFYRINPKNELIDLGNEFDFPLDLDSIKTSQLLKKAIKNINRENN